MNMSLPQLIAVYAIPVLFAITLHEAAHAWASSRLGDSTARLLGRTSLNPIRHIDPVGTVVVPLLILLTSKALGGGGMLFGWAKPVPIEVARLRRPRRDLGLVAAAGPAANIVMALLWAGLLKLLTVFQIEQDFPMLVAQAGILVNVGLAVINLLPLPPLDGGRILAAFLPYRAAITFYRIEPYGLLIVLGLLATGVLGLVTVPAFRFGVDVISTLFNFAG